MPQRNLLVGVSSFVMHNVFCATKTLNVKTIFKSNLEIDSL
jgi:hypothetical protein